MICDICTKEGAFTRLVTQAYGEGDQVIVVERVPIVICPNCGESYLTWDTMKQIDDTIDEKETRAALRQIPVATLS